MTLLAVDISSAFATFGGYILAGFVGFGLGVWKERSVHKRRKGEGGFVPAQVLLGALSILAVVMTVAMIVGMILLGQANATNAASKASVAEANAQIDLLKEQSDDNERQSDCQQKALEHLIGALLPRSSFAEQEAAIQLVYAKRQLHFLVAVRAGGSGDKTLDELIEAEHVRIKALDELLDSVATTDLPSLTEIEACRN